MTRAEIEITPDNLWFLERYLNVFEFLEMFPLDVISSDARRGVAVTFQTDLGFQFESDIEGDKLQLRNRSKHRGWMKWTIEHGLNLGDKIIIERTGERAFSLRLEPNRSVSD